MASVRSSVTVPQVVQYAYQNLQIIKEDKWVAKCKYCDQVITEKKGTTSGFVSMDGSCLELALEGERLCKSGDCRAGVRCFEAAVQVGTSNLRILSAIYSQLGNAYFYLRDYNRSLEFHKYDLNLARTIGDRAGEAKASGNLGNTLKLLDKFDEAVACCQRQLDICKEIDDTCDAGEKTKEIMVLLRSAEGLRLGRLAVDLLNVLGKEAGKGRALYNLGSVYHAKGKRGSRVTSQEPGEFPPEVRESLENAVRYYEANLQIMRELGDRAVEGRACGNLGNTHYLLGNFEQAIAFHEQRLTIAKEFGDKSAERRAYSNLGNAYIFRGEFNAAADLYNKTLTLAVDLADRALEAQACYSLGNTYTLLRDYDHAIEYHVRHLGIARELGDRVGEARACWSLGNAYAAQHRNDLALHYTTLHLEISREIGDSTGQMTAEMNLADLQLSISQGTSAMKRANSCREKTVIEEESQPDRGRRRSMENMELVKLTPDKLASEGRNRMIENTELSNACKPSLDFGGSDRISDELGATGKSQQHLVDDGDAGVGSEEDSFFDMLSRFQGRRIDDQRCCSSVLDNNALRVTPTEDDDKENVCVQANVNVDDEFFDMIAGIQGSRMDDQRSSVAVFPGLHRSRTVIGQFVATRQQEDNALDDQFFDMLMRCQGARIEEQRSELPVVQLSAPTVPDEDFIALIQRFQSNRLEEQRSSLPNATMPILLSSSSGVRRVASYGSWSKGGNRRKK